VVGGGPSGFYAAEALLKADGVEVDMLERLPAPYGLVRYGVAPDHPKLKLPALAYARIAAAPGFRFIGGVSLGRDVDIETLRAAYHAVIVCCGAGSDRPMGIPGESLAGSRTATEFVGWYNGHPDYAGRSFDLAHECVAIVGHGNVALDVCRILAKPVDALRHTDICEHALQVLSRSKVRDIHLIGRRGPAQARFTDKELRELGEIPGVEVRVDSADLELDPVSQAESSAQGSGAIAWNMEALRDLASRPSDRGGKRIHLHFLKSPVELIGDGRVGGLRLEKNRLAGPPFGQWAIGTGLTEVLECGLVFRSVGYKGVPIAGLPFDARLGLIPNREGRVTEGEVPIAGLYCAGWIKRGPTGIIGTNRADANETVANVLADLNVQRQLPPREGADGFLRGLDVRGVRYLDFEGWLKIDAQEVARGIAAGKPREKFVRIDEMLDVAGR